MNLNLIKAVELPTYGMSVIVVTVCKVIQKLLTSGFSVPHRCNKK